MLVAVSPFPKLPGPLIVEGDCLVISDVHAPFHDADFLNAVIDLALKYGIRKAVVAGDVIEFAAFSFYGRTRYVEAEQELNACKQVMDSLASAFDDIVLIMGNHEQRFSRMIGAALDAEQLLAKWIANPKVRTSRLHWCDVISGGRKWRVEHPTSTSVNAGVVPAKLCAKYHCSVIGAHGHVWGQTRDVSGDYYAIDSGVIVDPGRLEYGYIAHGTRPAQMQGACLLVGGIPILLCPDNISFY